MKQPKRITLIDAELDYHKMPIYNSIKKNGKESWLEELINSETFSVHLEEMKNELKRFKDIIEKSDKKPTKINITNKRKTRIKIIDNNILKNRKVLLKANAYHLKNLVICKMMEIIKNNEMAFHIQLDEETRKFLNETIVSKSFGFVTLAVKSEIFSAALKGN